MEPLKPDDVEKALSLGATKEELAEYNRLVAERFATNPYLTRSPGEDRKTRDREKRIGDLYQKLFSDVRLHGAVDISDTASRHRDLSNI